jgi:NADH-quinone oxidoreductase subunit A
MSFGSKGGTFHLGIRDFMLFNYANVLVFILVGVGFIFATLFIGSFLRPQIPTLEKLSIYECGEKPIGSAWMNFNIRFYVVALIFVVFDVEVAFMFPIARVFSEWVRRDNGWLALAEIFVFLAILLVGFAYAWVKGDLNWVKKISQEIRQSA